MLAQYDTAHQSAAHTVVAASTGMRVWIITKADSRLTRKIFFLTESAEPARNSL
jgi:hypothetical protein